MAKQELETMRELLRISPSAQMLFAGETLAAASPAALRMFPLAHEGAGAEEIFGTYTEDFRRFVPGSSLLFAMEEPELSCDVTLTGCGEFVLATAVETGERLGMQTVLSIADRLRQPMSTILAVTPKLLPLLEDVPEPRAMDWAAALNRSLYSMLRTAGNLQLYGASGEGLALQPERVELRAWLEELLDRVQPLAEASGHSLIRALDPGTCVLEMDPVRMEQAVLNLISNAMKFSEPGTRIEVSAHFTDTQAVLTVRDQGCGIPPDQMGQIFSRSENRGAVPDPRYGVGLGLSLTRRIIQAHGGRMMLESGEGGTAVHLSLQVRGSRDQILRTPVKVPETSSGVDSVLLELADALPDGVFDTRGIDL